MTINCTLLQSVPHSTRSKCFKSMPRRHVLSKAYLMSYFLFFCLLTLLCPASSAKNRGKNVVIEQSAIDSYESNSAVSAFKCKEHPIEQNVENADVILVGTVRKIERNYSESIYDAFVQIHRIIKGHHQIYELVSSNYEYSKYIMENDRALTSSEALLYRNVTKRAATKFTVNGHVVTITNFGNTQICDSHVKPHEVRVFMLTLEPNPQPQHHQYYSKRLVLNSSSIQIKLNGPKNLNSFIESENYEDAKNIPCPQSISNLCNFGAICMINPVNNTVVCECDINCDRYEPMNLCGHDGVTYPSLCHLKQTKCLQQRPIKIITHDTCEQLERNLCRSKVCPNYGKCVIDENGFFAKCICPSECDYSPSSNQLDSYGSYNRKETKLRADKESISNELFSQTICGNDGKNYNNFCELKQQSCLQNKEIKIFYFGKCNPCNDLVCEYPKVCRLNSHRKPICACDIHCTPEFKPVCGSDGKTYVNECYMRLESCHINRPINRLYATDCSLIQNPCEPLGCDHYIGSYCEIDSYGKAYCKCEEKCEKILNYVCGSDGVTYENECHLRKEACLSNTIITLSHVGICGSMNPCVDHQCNFGGTCEIINNVPSCECPDCSEVYRPVCGADSVTYNNICKLRRESCLQQTLIQVAYEGACDPCKSVTCPNYGTCVESISGTSCVCPECSDNYMSNSVSSFMVCGSNGVTYNSVCHLQMQSCRTNTSITVLNSGPCDACMQTQCDSEPNYVCGSDGKTYLNECYLNKEACLNRSKITLVRRGTCQNQNEDRNLLFYEYSPKLSCNECKFNSECQLFTDNNTIQCTCHKFECHHYPRNIVCGSNGLLYSSRCDMNRDQCHKQKEIVERPLNECLQSVSVCNGHRIEFNPETGSGYECSDDRECPIQSYCDRVNSRCCSKRLQPVLSEATRCSKHSDCKGENMMCISYKCMPVTNCLNSTYGCCDDGYTPAKGPNGYNCPKICNCHPAGSYNQFCDLETGQCPCRPGVVGRLCDSCTTGYWGIKKILDSKTVGCLPCSCNKYGSIREDCNQEDGRCECKPNVFGIKCNECPSDQELTPDGCKSATEKKKQVERLCKKINCNYPGSYCSVEDNVPKCVCDTIDCQSDGIRVCGDDGQTYASNCDMIKFSCAKNTHINLAYTGLCSQGFDHVFKKNNGIAELNRSRPFEFKNDYRDYQPFHLNDNDENAVYAKIHFHSFMPYGTKKCMRDYECGRNMECLENICYCSMGFIPENDHCIDPSTPFKKNSYSGNNLKRYTFDACKSRPCSFGSFCQSLNNAKFMCHCPLGKIGDLCEKRVDSIAMPSFKTHSFYELLMPAVRLDDFNFEMEFKSNQPDGQLFFASENLDGTGNFLSLTLRNGLIEIRINDDGSENPKTFHPPNSIELKKYHRLFIQKAREYLFVQIDDMIPFRKDFRFKKGLVQNSFIVGNLEQVAKISNITRLKLNMTIGFVGCLQYLRINDKAFNLTFPSVDTLNGANIEDCKDKKCSKLLCYNSSRCRLTNGLNRKLKAECVCKRGFSGKHCQNRINACLSSPCAFANESSVCVPTSVGSFKCICSDNRDGEYCQSNVKIKRPFSANLNGKSYIEQEGIDLNFKFIDIAFLTRKTEGLLLFNADTESSNYLVLQIKNSYVHFEISLNNQSVAIISRNPINTRKWHQVRIIRENQIFKMLLDSDNLIKSDEIKIPSECKFKESLFVGGLKENSRMNPKFSKLRGLKGALQKVNIQKSYFLNKAQRFRLDFRAQAIELGGVNEYHGFPCNHTKCGDGGVCVPILNKFKCKCEDGYKGELCETKIARKIREGVTDTNSFIMLASRNSTALYFDGHTELLYRNRISEMLKTQSTNKFEITFKTKKKNGLLLYTGNGNLNSYLIIAFLNGNMVYSFSLPKQKRTFTLTSSHKLNDNKWHTVVIERSKRRTLMNIDNEQRLNGTFDEVNYVGFGSLITDGYLRVGGYRKLPFGMTQSLYQGFQGCISEFKVDDRIIDLIQNNLNKSFNPASCR